METSQKLAYPIGHHRKGTYWLMYFRLDSSKLTEINKALRIKRNGPPQPDPEGRAPAGGSPGGPCQRYGQGEAGGRSGSSAETAV